MMNICSVTAFRRLPVSCLVVLLLSGSLLVGCGGSDKPRGELTVTVTYGGKPVTEGHVDLTNDQSGEGSGADLNEKGVATFSNVLLGKYSVTVQPPQAIVVPGEAAPAAKNYPNIPEKFRSAATSPLKAEVTNDSRDLKFDLKTAK